MKYTLLGFLFICAMCGVMWCFTMFVEKWPHVFFAGMVLILSYCFGSLIKQVIELHRKLK